MTEYVDVRGGVKYFPYRTALVHNPFMSVPRDSVRDLEVELAAVAGVHPDNHTVYEVTSASEGKLYIRFSDFTATFGHTVKVGRW